MKITKIKKLRSEGYTFDRIGEMFDRPVTGERVRQILRGLKKDKCKEHKILYEKECEYCFIEKEYLKVLKRMKNKDFVFESNRLAMPNRSKAVVIQRGMFIKMLREELGLSYPEIGDMLSRDHTSIVNLYKRYAKKN